MKKILVPTDFSNEATAATNVACQLGRKGNAEVTLLHVIEMPGGSSFRTQGPAADTNDPGKNIYVAELLKQGQEKMEQLVNEDKFEGTLLNYHIVVGDPYQGIADITAEQKMDMIVMGTKGASGLEEFLVGSNTEKVVRKSTIPVITIKKELDIEQIKTIAFASSLRDEDEVLATHLKTLQTMLGAKLKLVRINTPNNFQSDHDTYANMDAFIKKYGFTNVSQHSYNDIIAMATHGRTGFAHLLSGSIAEDVVNHAIRPVWVFNVK